MLFVGTIICFRQLTNGRNSSEWPRTPARFGVAQHHGAWASYQIRKIAGCACAGNAGIVFTLPPTLMETISLRSRHAARLVRDARAVMHVGIAYPRWWGKRSRHSRRKRNQQFYVSGKRRMFLNFTGQYGETIMNYWPLRDWILRKSC